MGQWHKRCHVGLGSRDICEAFARVCLEAPSRNRGVAARLLVSVSGFAGVGIGLRMSTKSPKA